MPHATSLRLLPVAERHARSALSPPRLQRGGPGCRVHTTADVLAILDGLRARPASAATEAALAALSTAVDRATAEARP